MGINVSIVRKKLKWQATPFRVEGLWALVADWICQQLQVQEWI